MQQIQSFISIMICFSDLAHIPASALVAQAEINAILIFHKLTFSELLNLSFCTPLLSCSIDGRRIFNSLSLSKDKKLQPKLGMSY